MTTPTPTTLNALAPCELTTGDRLIGWMEDIDERSLTELPWDDTYDHEWTVESTATGPHHEERIYFIDGTWMDFEPCALMLAVRNES